MLNPMQIVVDFWGFAWVREIYILKSSSRFYVHILLLFCIFTIKIPIFTLKTAFFLPQSFYSIILPILEQIVVDFYK